MITPEQKKEIVTYLLSKKLPIDLVLEVEDHMINQIEDSHEPDFEKAFEEARESWDYELELIFSVQNGFKYITRFQKRIINKTYNEILKRTTLIFFGYLVFSIFLAFYSKQISQHFFLLIYSIIGLITIYSSIRYFRIWETAAIKEKRRISIYQRGSLLFFTGGVFVLIYNLMSFEPRFEKFYTSALKFANISNFQSDDFFIFLHTYLYVFAWIFGSFYFLKYRKIVKELQQQINLKL